jgi:hypothetical protein
MSASGQKRTQRIDWGCLLCALKRTSGGSVKRVRHVPIAEILGLSSGVLIDVLFLRVMDSNQRFDRLNHALRVAHQIFVHILWA